MDIEGILNSYEDSQRKKAEAEAKRRDDELTRKQLNAIKVQAHLRAVVEPVFNDTANRLKAHNYTAKVEIVSVSVAPGLESAFALRFRLETRTASYAPDSYLGYYGNFDDLSVEVESSVVKDRESGRVVKENPRPLAYFTKETVEQRVEAFVLAAFPV